MSKKKAAPKEEKRVVSRSHAKSIVKLPKEVKSFMASFDTKEGRTHFKNLMLDAVYAAEIQKRSSGKRKEESADSSVTV